MKKVVGFMLKIVILVLNIFLYLYSLLLWFSAKEVNDFNDRMSLIVLIIAFASSFISACVVDIYNDKWKKRKDDLKSSFLFYI